MKKKRKNKKKNKKKIREKKTFLHLIRPFLLSLILIILSSVTGALVYITAQSVEGILHSDIFVIKSVKWSGNQRVTDEEIEKKVKALIPGKTSLFDFNIDKLRHLLEENEWVKEVLVRRVPPDTLEIHLKEYQPLAKIRRPEGDYLMDVEGHVFKKVKDGEEYEYPVVLGTPNREDILHLKRLITKYESIMKSKLSQIVFGKNGVLLEDEKGKHFKLSSVEEYNKLKIARKIEKKMGNALDKAKYIDLRFKDRIVVGF